MHIPAAGSPPSRIGSPEAFTGAARIDPVIKAVAPARAEAAFVTLEPGARTAWHTHSLEQALVVLSGLGLAQSFGGPVREMRPGDTVRFEPGEKHWHGAHPEVAVHYLAIHEDLNGSHVTLLEHVTDAQYRCQGGIVAARNGNEDH